MPNLKKNFDNVVKGIIYFSESLKYEREVESEKNSYFVRSGSKKIWYAYILLPH